MRLEDRIWINAPPEAIFSFFEAMETNYLRWHPDHRLFRFEQGRGLREGVVVYFEEVIGDKVLKKRVHYTRIVPNRHIEFTFVKGLFRLFLPRMVFRMEPQDGGTLFVAQIDIRIGPIGAWLNRRDFQRVRQHMREEGENLKQLIE